MNNTPDIGAALACISQAIAASDSVYVQKMLVEAVKHLAPANE